MIRNHLCKFRKWYGFNNSNWALPPPPSLWLGLRGIMPGCQKDINNFMQCSWWFLQSLPRMPCTFINDSFKALLYVFKNTFKIIIFYILKRKKTSNMYQTSTKFKLLSLLIGYLELQMNALAFVFSFHNSSNHFPPIPLSSLEHTLML